jgi:spore germination cell wall hydrolase CwlJ-like protein
MFWRSLLGFGVLLTGASCVPPASHRVASAGPLAASDQEERRTIILPPPEVMAREIAPGHAAKPFTIAAQSESDRLNSLQCLTAAVYYEARSETEGGQRAVAQVVLNRVRHPAFPKSICGVVYQGSKRRTGCQFSFTCDGSMNRGTEPGAWARARRIASEALAGHVYAPVGLATHFHTTAIHPWWADSLARAVTVGSHIFYRWRGEWGDPKSFRRPYTGQEQAYASAGEQARPAGRGGEQVVAGVTIHRIAIARAPAAADTPSTAGARTVRDRPGVTMVAGVRIHRIGSVAGVRVHSGTPGGQEQTSPAADGNDPDAESAPAR